MPKISDPDWQSLNRYHIPDWYRDAKLGIFIHWGVYAVPAYSDEWYPRLMYRRDEASLLGLNVYQYHREVFGPQGKFGYKDFIPMFKAEDWDPESWADLFLASGARYVIPVAEHHDGFAMYATDYTPWNAARMGPRRDIIRELMQAVRARGLKFGVSTHRAYNWRYYTYEDEFDTSDPLYSDLYSPRHLQDQPASPGWLQDWYNRTLELIDQFEPDILYFDFGWHYDEFHPYHPKILAYYYNQAQEWGKEVVLNYKDKLPDGVAVYDIERNKSTYIRPEPWQSDTALSFLSWGYIQNDALKTATTIIHEFVDIVSKNGNLLINVGPQADGVIPGEQAYLLRELGRWLQINGEAIYGSRPWIIAGESEARLVEGPFAEIQAYPLTASDIRFTTKGDVLYAILPRWPGEQVRVKSLRTDSHVNTEKVKTIHMLGCDQILDWLQDEQALTIRMPAKKPCDHAYTLKIEFEDK